MSGRKNPSSEKQLARVSQAAAIVAAANSGDFAKARALIEAIKAEKKGAAQAEVAVEKKVVRQAVKQAVKETQAQRPAAPRRPPAPDRERKAAVRTALSSSVLTPAQRAIAATIMAPGKFVARFPALRAVPTAVLPLTCTDDLPGNAAGTGVSGSPELPASELCAIKFKDSWLRSLMLWYPIITAKPLYAAKWNQVGVIGSNITWNMVPGVEYDLNPLYFGYVSGTKIHGDNLYFARGMNGKRYFPLNGSGDTTSGNATITWTFNNPAVNTQVTIKLYYTASGENELVVNEQTVTNGTTSVISQPDSTHRVSGYYRCTASLTAVAGQVQPAITGYTFSANLNVVAANGYSGWGITALPGLEGVMANIDEYTTNGSGLVVTQASSVTNANGRVLQVEHPAGSPTFVAALKTFAQLGKTNSKEVRARDLYKGASAYIKPGELADFNLESEFDFDSAGAMCQAEYSLTSTEPFVQFALYVPTLNGQVFSYTQEDSLEWTTAHPWTNLSGARTGHNADLTRAVEEIAMFPQFFDNPDHGKAIAGLLGAGGRMAQMLAPMAGQYGPALAVGGMMAEGLGDFFA